MSPRQLKVVYPKRIAVCFDTSSIIAADSPHRLFHAKAMSLLESVRTSDHVHVEWYIPELVVEERRYRMKEKARKIAQDLPAIDAISGRSLNMTPDEFVGAVDPLIESQLQALNVRMLPVPNDGSTLRELASRAVERRAPFEDKDKGFRDAVIAESFLSFCRNTIVNDPLVPPIERHYWFVAGDKLLKRFAEERRPIGMRFHILGSCDEVISLLNAIEANLPADVLARLTEAATRMFYTEGDPNSFLVSSGILSHLQSLCGTDGSTHVPAYTFSVERALFGSLVGDSITWTSGVRFVANYVEWLPHDVERRLSGRPVYNRALGLIARVEWPFTAMWLTTWTGSDELFSPYLQFMWCERVIVDWWDENGVPHTDVIEGLEEETTIGEANLSPPS